MNTLLSVVIAAFVGMTLLLGIDRLARSGALDSGAKWYARGPAWIIMSHVASLITLWILKSYQVGFEETGGNAFRPWCGIVRRLDDLSWWTMLMGTTVGVVMIWYAGGLTFSGPSASPVRKAWRIVAPIGLVLYVVAVSVGNGTFFSRTGTAYIARMQVVEGTVVMSYILTSYLFVATLVNVIIARKPWAKAITASVLIGGVLALVAIASALCTIVGNRWSDCGFMQQPNYGNGRFWLFAGTVWWPWLVVAVVAIFTFSAPDDESKHKS